MNSGSKIDISKSSLLSLKAELARKHEEANRSKAQAQGNYIKPLAKPAKSAVFSKSNAGIESRQQNDVEELTPDEGAQLSKSRAALEAKARLYDSLAEGASSADANYLVNFAEKSHHKSLEEKEAATKEAEEAKQREKEEEEEEARRAESDEYDAPSDPEEDWVDYTDSFGRTRRCLRKDLSRFRELDERLMQSATPTVIEPDDHTPGLPDLLSDDMRREMQRRKWEHQEEKLVNKPDVHYQDILFDEARTHGVGYFPFAREENARRAQQDDLKKLRAETQRHQAAATAQRERRRQQMQARLRAAHNRKRAREGLPPLADDEEIPGQEEEKLGPGPPAAPEPYVQKASGTRPDPSPKIRPWDIGKEGVPGGVPVMSQEEWVGKKRLERKREFAPFYEDRRGDVSEIALPPEPRGGLFFSSKKHKSALREEVRLPMEEEEEVSLGLSDAAHKRGTGSRRTVGAEIAPPPTFDYFGPSESAVNASKRDARDAQTSSGSSEALSNAISAGLQYLRKQAEEKDKRKEKGLIDIL